MAAMDSTLRERVIALVEPELRLAGSELVELELLGGGHRLTLRFSVEKARGRVLEGPDRAERGRITLDECAELSRMIARVLEAADSGDEEFLPPRYTIEVSSPGIFRRLRLPEHFVRFVGERIQLTVEDENSDLTRQLRVTLIGADEQQIKVTDEAGAVWQIPHPRIRKANLDPDLDFRRGHG